MATFATGPFLGLDQGIAKQYLRCLSLFSAMAQLGSEHATCVFFPSHQGNAGADCRLFYRSRWIALAAIEGAVSSEALYAAASDYDSQISQIVPALLFNCLRVSISELQQEWVHFRSLTRIHANNLPAEPAPATLPHALQSNLLSPSASPPPSSPLPLHPRLLN